MNFGHTMAEHHWIIPHKYPFDHPDQSHSSRIESSHEDSVSARTHDHVLGVTRAVKEFIGHWLSTFDETTFHLFQNDIGAASSVCRIQIKYFL